jgi:hypothetical protein
MSSPASRAYLCPRSLAYGHAGRCCRTRPLALRLADGGLLVAGDLVRGRRATAWGRREPRTAGPPHQGRGMRRVAGRWVLTCPACACCLCIPKPGEEGQAA